MDACSATEKRVPSGAAAGSSVSQLFSTHPPTSDRIDRIAKKATADGYKRPTK